MTYKLNLTFKAHSNVNEYLNSNAEISSPAAPEAEDLRHYRELNCILCLISTAKLKK